jgi:hypothetical protein
MTERLIEIDWDPDSHWYNVRARATENEPWGCFDGPEEDVDILLGLARDRRVTTRSSRL